VHLIILLNSADVIVTFYFGDHGVSTNQLMWQINLCSFIQPRLGVSTDLVADGPRPQLMIDVYVFNGRCLFEPSPSHICVVLLSFFPPVPTA
jgi:hypothetical protein